MFNVSALIPETAAAVTYENIDFRYSLFNQYGSGLTYEIYFYYSTYYANVENIILLYQLDSGSPVIYFNEWDYIGSTYCSAVLNSTWTYRINSVLFGRNFDDNSKKAETYPLLQFRHGNAYSSVSWALSIKSKIGFNVSIGSALLAFANTMADISANDKTYITLDFFDVNDDLLNYFTLLDATTGTAANTWLYGFSNILTNVRRFDIEFRFIDTPPYITYGTTSMTIHEFNLFATNEIKVLDDPIDDAAFGTEYIACEWYDVLGHLNNFIYWLVNESFFSTLFSMLANLVVFIWDMIIDLFAGVLL
jgi:hypothetical protein